jgi:hypothetical protein
MPGRSEDESAVFHVFGIDVHCRIAEDGHRVMDDRSVEDLIEAIAGDADPGEIDALAEWQRGAPMEALPNAAERHEGVWLKRLVGRLQSVEDDNGGAIRRQKRA